jgi:hypothetical protein
MRFFLSSSLVPNASPNLKPVGYNTSSTSLNVSWTAIARSDINGVLRGYTVFYKPSSSHESVRAITVPPGKLYVHLTGLRKFAEYEVRVAGVTSKGTGGMSAKSLVFTDEDGKRNFVFKTTLFLNILFYLNLSNNPRSVSFFSTKFVVNYKAMFCSAKCPACFSFPWSHRFHIHSASMVQSY